MTIAFDTILRQVDTFNRPYGPPAAESRNSTGDEIIARTRLMAREMSSTGPLEQLICVYELFVERFDARLVGVDFSRLMEQRVANCVEATLLLILLGKLLGIPVSGVHVPNHVFARARISGRTTNMEPANLRGFPNDEAYRLSYHLTPAQMATGVYLVDLRDEEFLGIVAHKIAHPHIVHGSPLSSHTRDLVRFSLRSIKRYPDVYNSLGMNYSLRGNSRCCHRALMKGLEIEPASHALTVNLISNLLTDRKYDEAYGKALSACKDCSLFESVELYRNLFRSALRVGEYSLAQIIMKLLDDYYGAMRTSPSDRHLLPYVAAVSYWTGDYDRSVRSAIDFASLHADNEVGIVWAVSALWRQGKEVEMEDLIARFGNTLSEYTSALAGLFNRTWAEEQVYESFPQWKHETQCYAGEYWVRLDPNPAISVWRECVTNCDSETYAHLRAYRSLQDLGA